MVYRRIEKVIIHCTDSDNLAHDNKETIRKWHVDERGWSDIGYHFLITKNPKIVPCRPVTREGAHTLGHNNHSIGIALTGRNIFSGDQIYLLQNLVISILDTHELTLFDVYGHNDFNANKTCPNFDMTEFKKDLYRRVRSGKESFDIGIAQGELRSWASD